MKTYAGVKRGKLALPRVICHDEWQHVVGSAKLSPNSSSECDKGKKTKKSQQCSDTKTSSSKTCNTKVSKKSVSGDGSSNSLFADLSLEEQPVPTKTAKRGQCRNKTAKHEVSIKPAATGNCTKVAQEIINFNEFSSYELNIESAGPDKVPIETNETNNTFNNSDELRLLEEQVKQAIADKKGKGARRQKAKPVQSQCSSSGKSAESDGVSVKKGRPRKTAGKCVKKSSPSPVDDFCEDIPDVSEPVVEVSDDSLDYAANSATCSSNNAFTNCGQKVQVDKNKENLKLSNDNCGHQVVAKLKKPLHAANLRVDNELALTSTPQFVTRRRNASKLNDLSESWCMSSIHSTSNCEEDTRVDVTVNSSIVPDSSMVSLFSSSSSSLPVNPHQITANRSLDIVECLQTSLQNVLSVDASNRYSSSASSCSNATCIERQRSTGDHRTSSSYNASDKSTDLGCGVPSYHSDGSVADDDDVVSVEDVVDVDDDDDDDGDGEFDSSASADENRLEELSEILEEDEQDSEEDDSTGPRHSDSGNQEGNESAKASINNSSLADEHVNDTSQNFSSLSFVEMLTPKPVRQKSIQPALSYRDKVLLQCGQQNPVPFAQFISPDRIDIVKKIGEGVYGEVFKAVRDSENVALKIIPVEGKRKVNDEVQKTFEEILPEILIAKEMSALRDGEDNQTDSFVYVRSVNLVQGPYPDQLLSMWDEFNVQKGSENDRPDFLPKSQLFLIFEFEDCGSNVESFGLKTASEARSIICQVALALAVAENALHFEHRDLHWGNVLVNYTKRPTLTYVLNGRSICVDSHGVKVSIIDFTLSRLTKDGCNIYTNLAADPALFEGQGDYQFDIYREMKVVNGNNWSVYEPKTNVLWIDYLVDKLLYAKTYRKGVKRTAEYLAVERMRQTIKNFDSATELVTDCPFFGC